MRELSKRERPVTLGVGRLRPRRLRFCSFSIHSEHGRVQGRITTLQIPELIYTCLRFFHRYRERFETEQIYGEAYLRWTYETALGRLAAWALVKRAWFTRHCL